ncbi:hypothetical protein [Pseudomonas alkylphenolica]|uniref:hypothetical protein n=1 Tax=Pseudomonas alkylphenolica TaxID=237609 RepID=UPI00315D8551
MPKAFAGADAHQLDAISDFEVTVESQAKAEQEITQHIQQGVGAEHLSSSTRQYLCWLLMVLALVANYLALQNGARSELGFIVPKVLPTMTASSYGKVVRAAMCDAAIPHEEFARHRTVKGVGAIYGLSLQ